MVGYLSKKPKTFFVDDPGKLYRQRRRATQAKGLETLDSKVKLEGPSKSPREPPPPSHDTGRPFKIEEDGEDGDGERSSTPKGRQSKIHMQGVCGARPCPRTPSLSSKLWRKY
jgi:hypothetical protein